MISDYCDQFSGMIPVGFVLGFFVTMVVERWWNQFNTIPWPANVALLVSANLQVSSPDTNADFFQRERETKKKFMRLVLIN